MKRIQSLTMFLPILTIILIIFSTALFSQTNPIKIPITIRDTTNGAYGPSWTVLYFGFHQNATYCADETIFNFAPCDDVTEILLPPKPPSGVFDARWIDSRSVAGACLDQGLRTNIHGFNGVAPRDTFRLNFQPSLSGFPLIVSWPNNLSTYFDSIYFRYVDPEIGPVILNMATTTSVQLQGVSFANIYTFRPKGTQTPPSTPALVSPIDGEVLLPLSITFSWNPATPSTNTYYRVQVSDDSLFTTIRKDSIVNGLSSTMNGLNINTKYFWRVKAMSFLEGCYQSVPFSFTTPYRLDTIMVTKSGNGTISPGGSVFAELATPTFTFTPDAGYYIDSVFVDDVYVGNNSSYQFAPLTENHTLHVKFSTLTITITKSGNGTVSPAESSFVALATPTFTFTPTVGWSVDSVFVDGVYVGNNSSYQFAPLTEDHTLHIKFSIMKVTLSTSVTHGSIIKIPDQPLYEYGTVVNLVIIPDSGFAFINWTGDASGTTNPLPVTMNGNKTIQALVYDIRDSKMYRTATMEQWALAHDIKGKFKANKRVTDRVNFKFNLIAPNTGILTLDFSGVVSTGTISKGVTSPVLLTNFTNVKKLTTLLSVSQGDTIVVEGLGLAGKKLRAKYSWGSRARYYQVLSYIINEPGLPLPNLVNVGEELFAQNAFPSNLVIGIPQGKKGASSVVHKRYSDVQKSLVKVINKGIILHKNGPRCLDSIGTKPITQQLLSLPPDKQNNKLFAELLTLKLNITSSAAEKFPIGLGELMYFNNSDSANPFNGLLVRDIAKYADTMLSCLPLVAINGETQADIYDVMNKINFEFSDSTLDTISFIGKTKLTGVKYLADATYLRYPDGVVALATLDLDNTLQNTPAQFILQQNYPNPFNPVTTVSFVLGQSSIVSLRIYNSVGQEVATLINNEGMESGAHEILFDATGLTSGVYFYRLRAGTFSETKKLILMK